MNRLLILSAVFFGFVACVQAEEEKAWSVDLSTAVLSDYMWRGFNLYDGISIQPSVGASYDTGSFGTFGGNVWSHLSAEGYDDEKDFTEIDYTLSYSISFDALSFGLGHIWYRYPSDQNGALPKTAEFYGTVSYDTWLSPKVSVYADYDEFDYQYYELGLSHTVETDALGKGFNVTPYVNFGFASSAEKAYDDDGLVQVTCGTSFDLSLGDISVTPSLNYTFKVDDATTNEFWAGTTFAYSF